MNRLHLGEIMRSRDRVVVMSGNMFFLGSGFIWCGCNPPSRL